MTGRMAAKRWSAVTGTLVVSGAMAFGLAPLAAAGSTTASQPAAPSSVLAPITHPDSDSLGSTIRAHDPAAVSSSVPTPKLTLGAKAVLAQPYGMDVSNYQGNINWTAAKQAGAAFVYIKATESTTYQNAYFSQQYNGSYAVGMIRGAYHFALPDRSSGATQAQYFFAHGGGWSADGHTLPPMLDVEYNPYGASTCYGLTPAQMVAWIRDFSNTVHALTTRYPVIYSTADWWNTCTGSNATFASTNPLFVARYASTPGVMPAGWSDQSIWQYNDHGTFPGDADVFNGSAAQLVAFAGAVTKTPAAAPTPTPTPTPTLTPTPKPTAKPTPSPTPSPKPKPTPTPTKPPVATPRPNPIDAYYTKLGGAKSYLGVPTTPLFTVVGGQGRKYQHGNIYYSVATGAHAVHGDILARYAALRGSIGSLGFPTTDEVRTPGGAGTFQNFSGSGGSSLYWTPGRGAFDVLGKIRSLWAKLGYERGRLGLPTTDEFSLPGGRQSNFQHGHITWLARSGVARVYYS